MYIVHRHPTSSADYAEMASSHRHFVAAPVFAFVVATTLLSGALSSASASLVPVEAEGIVQLPFGAVGRVSAGSAMDDSAAIPALTEGEMLVSGEHQLLLRSSHLFLMGFRGGYHVISDGAGLTVAALTTPVLLSTGAGERFIVPADMQWRGSASDLFESDLSALIGALSPLPPDYLKEKVVALEALKEHQQGIAVSPEANEDFTALSAFHPELRSGVRDAPTGPSFLPVLLLADRSAEPLPTELVESWKQNVTAVVQQSKDPKRALAPFLQALTRFLEEHAARFPDRAQRYTDILTVIAERYEPIMTEELALLQGWKQKLGAPQYDPIPRETESRDPSPEVPAAPFDPVATEAAARTILSQANALWTLQTTVTPLSASTAHIDGIGFPTLQGDKLFTFDIDISTSAVHTIVLDGKVLPNTLPLAAFIEWVGQN